MADCRHSMTVVPALRGDTTAKFTFTGAGTAS
jgi:hypothetical protein